MHAAEVREETVRTRILDTRGEICPYPFIRTKDALEALPPGGVLEVLTDNRPTAERSIPRHCEEVGAAYAVRREGDVWRIRIRKG
jgi:TusA-related sulfurtransferase